MTPDGTEPDDALPTEEERARILARPDMLTVQQFADRFGIPRPLVDKRHAAGKLLALRLGGKRRYLYPAWQGRMVADEASRMLFEQVLGLIGPARSWAIYRFFTTPSAPLGGKTPVDAWRATSARTMMDAVVHSIGHSM